MAIIHVVIPVYNAVHYLRDTVESVLRQPSKEIDIVLVNDGSTDGSAELCNDLADSNARISVIHQNNKGVSAARNTGIEYILGNNAEGYVAFLDADDLWIPGVITEELAETIKNSKTIDVFEFGCINSNSDGTKFNVSFLHQACIKSGGSGVIWPMVGHFCANLYNVRLFAKWNIRFVEGLKYSEDKIFRMQCVFLAEKVQFCPQILHIYRENPTSVMRKMFSYTPIDYYIPIIDGWIQSDAFVNAYEPISGKHLDAGQTLASIYFGDMIVEHFKRWHSNRAIQETCHLHPYYYLFKNMDPKSVSIKQYKNQQLYLHHPTLFRLMYSMIGAVEYIARLALRIKPIYKFRQHKKYPLHKIPN